MAAALVGGTFAVGLGWTLAGLNKGPPRLTPVTEQADPKELPPTAPSPKDATGSVAEVAPTSSLARPETASEGHIRGRAEVLDTATLRISGRLVRLYGVEWARGGKVDDLRSYLHNREVRCEAGADTAFRCKVDGQDLSRVVLYNGGGKATMYAPLDLKTAEAHAREAGLGVWAKNYQ